MSHRAAIIAAGFALVAGCHLIGGTNGLYIVSGEGGAPAAGGAGGEGAGGESVGGLFGGAGGEGGGVMLCDPMDCAVPSTTCAEAACINNMCGYTFLAPASACSDNGGSYCDGAGNCVECTENMHCANNGVCQQHVCHDATCDDGMMDGNETGIDCGGTCGGCANGNSCNAFTDCASLVCTSSTCVPCAQNGDCPGTHYCKDASCREKKSGGSVCGSGAECKSNVCVVFLCL